MSSATTKVTATDIKKRLAYHLLMTSGYHIVGIEVEKLNKPDLVAINKNRYITEFEIKLTRADLLGELRSAQARSAGDPRGTGVDLSKCAKLAKHCDYHGYATSRPDFHSHPMFDSLYDKPRYRPHRFISVVPSDLVDIALELLSGSPYGLMEISYWRIVKRPAYLHKDEQPCVASAIAHSLSLWAWWTNHGEPNVEQHPSLQPPAPPQSARKSQTGRRPTPEFESWPPRPMKRSGPPSGQS